MGKVQSTFGHKQLIVGRDFNTRTLSFSLPNNKRAAIAELLTEWLTKTKYTILKAAELHSKLADASCANRKGTSERILQEKKQDPTLQSAITQTFALESKLTYCTRHGSVTVGNLNNTYSNSPCPA
jgi:hypothetical protein